MARDVTRPSVVTRKPVTDAGQRVDEPKSRVGRGPENRGLPFFLFRKRTARETRKEETGARKGQGKGKAGHRRAAVRSVVAEGKTNACALQGSCQTQTQRGALNGMNVAGARLLQNANAIPLTAPGTVRWLQGYARCNSKARAVCLVSLLQNAKTVPGTIPPNKDPT